MENLHYATSQCAVGYQGQVITSVLHKAYVALGASASLHISKVHALLLGSRHSSSLVWLYVKPWKRKQNCMMIGQQIDPFKHPEIHLSESAGTWHRPIGGKRQTNLFQAQAAQTSKRESKGGFFAISSYLSFLDIFGVFLRHCQVISPEAWSYDLLNEELNHNSASFDRRGHSSVTMLVPHHQSVACNGHFTDQCLGRNSWTIPKSNMRHCITLSLLNFTPMCGLS
jgi:hypothetical protein